MTLSGKQFLVIGSNGVLGRAISESLTSQGAKVIGTARSNESAANLSPAIAQALLLDLESSESIETLTNYIINADVPIDGVVIASGRVAFGSIAETPAQDAKRLMQINHLGPVQLIAALTPQLAKSANGPVVLSISGVVAEKVFPGMSAYIASKTAHSSWLRAYALEARRAKIRVVDARPGHTETGLATRPLFGTAPNFAQGMTPEHVASVIVAAIASDTADLPSEAFN